MMPNAEEMSKSSERMYERFKLPGFALAVDGMHVRFVEAHVSGDYVRLKDTSHSRKDLK